MEEQIALASLKRPHAISDRVPQSPRVLCLAQVMDTVKMEAQPAREELIMITFALPARRPSAVALFPDLQLPLRAHAMSLE